MKLSKSAVNTFKKCPRAFKYQFIDKIENEPNKYMLFGTLIHKVAEDIAKEIQSLGVINEVIIRDLCNKYYPKDTIFDSEVIDLHMSNLYDFFIKTFIVYGYKIFSIEEYIIDTDINLSGLADLVLEDTDGNLVVVDYKTGKSGSIKKYRVELCYYKRLIEFKYPNKTVVTAGIFFTKDSGYRFVNFTECQKKGAYITKKDYNSTFQLLTLIRSQVEEGNLYPKRQYTCQYCSYKDLCKKDGGF